MELSELKTGMLVELNCGNRCIVLGNEIIGDTRMSMGRYNYNLKYFDKQYSWFDIMKVWSTNVIDVELLPSEIQCSFNTATSNRTLLWTR